MNSWQMQRPRVSPRPFYVTESSRSALTTHWHSMLGDGAESSQRAGGGGRTHRARLAGTSTRAESDYRGMCAKKRGNRSTSSLCRTDRTVLHRRLSVLPKRRLGEGPVLVVPPRRAGSAFLPILHFRVLDGLPLHVARRICAAGAEGNDVVDYIARPTVGIAAAPQELISCFPAAGNPSSTVRRRARVRTSGWRAIGSSAWHATCSRGGVAAWSWCRCGVAAAMRRRSRVGRDMRSIASRVAAHVHPAALCVERRGENRRRPSGRA